MFWKFTLESSGLDNILSKQDVTLLEVLDEEEVLQECKTPNEKLLDFLTGNEILKELLHLVIDKPSDDLEDSVKYKYMNIATEIIILDIDVILEKIASDEEFLDIIWSFTDNLKPLNPLIASFFSKVITMLVCRKSQQTFEYMKTRDAVNKLIVHIEISAFMELFIKMVTVVEQPDIKMEICRWLSEEQLIEKLIDFLHPSEDEQKHFYAGQLLSELVHIGRDSISQFLDSDEQNIENPLLLTLERRDIIEKLLSVIFDGIDQPNSDSSVINGISVISSLIEIRRPTIEGIEELITPMDVDRIAQGCHTALEVLSTKLSDFHDVLVRPYPMCAMETTFGLLDPPLGKVRLSIAGLIAAAISTCSLIINDSLAKTGTLNILLDLFSRYEWNNFLHTHVQQCIFGVLSSELHSLADGDAEPCQNTSSDSLVKHLFQECNIVQRCLNLWESNEISEKSGNPRKGYMGHLTKIINQIKNSKEKGPNVETVQSMFNEFSDELRQEWNDLCEGSLEEINKKNICTSMKSWFTPMDSDSEGDDYRHTTITQYDGTMQQAFENYQVKPMSNEFIESFGYDENSLQENENIKNPFDEVGKIDFTINANEESENEKLYNNICEQKIRPFDDSSSDEEDMWEEKELTFTHPPQPRESGDTIHSDSDSSSDEEKELKVESPDSMDIVFTENMDVDNGKIDNEWTANFDAFGVSTGDTASEWPTANTVVAPLSTNGENFADFSALSTNGEDFADFSDISKFENANDIAGNAFDMETETSAKPAASSPYEVKMEEDSPTSTEPSPLEKDSMEEFIGENGVVAVETTVSPSSPPDATSTDPPSSSTQVQIVQSSSIHIQIDSETNADNNSETIQNVAPTPEETRSSPEGEPQNIEQSSVAPTEPSPSPSPEHTEVDVSVDNNDRTCINEIVIDVNEQQQPQQPPSSLVTDKQQQQQQQQQQSNVVVETQSSADEDSVLLNGPPSSELAVNPTGNLAT